MFKKDNIFFVISCLLLLGLLWMYKVYVDLKIDYKILNSEITNIKSNQELEGNYDFDKPSYKEGAFFETINVIDINGEKIEYPTKNTKKKIVVFTNSTCSFCEKYYFSLDSLITKNPNLDITVIQEDTNYKTNKLFLQDNGFKFKMLVPTDSVFKKLNINYTPTTFILNSDNTVSKTLDLAVYQKELLAYFNLSN